MSAEASSDLNQTLEFRPDEAAEEPAARRAAVLVEGSGPALTDETQSLLRRRLQMAAWLLAAGFLAFLVDRVIQLDELATTLDWSVFAAHIAVTAVTGFMAVRLYCNCPIAHSRLRLTELIVFGFPALFFSMVSYAALIDGARSHYVASISPMWMVLIFTYALFIPNTWRRAAVAIGLMAAAPIAIMVFVRLTSDGLDTLISDGAYLKQNVLDHSLVLGLSALIGVWGVATINSLRREAFEARQFGHYQLRQPLGSGGMGDVYLAEHLLLKRPCAIKVIRPDRAGDATALARFEREVRATARLTHWNTVEIFDYGQAQDGTFYYVMEYLPGMNLDDLVRMHGPLPPERIVHLLLQACDALQEAHSQGLIHRDIKPANIFATHRGGVSDVVKLLDFGLAKPVSSGDDIELTQDAAITGSPLYMSPEQAQGEPLDARSDVYSLGAVAWFLGVGRPLFQHDSAIKAMLAHAGETPQPPSELNPTIPEQLDAVIMSCLAKDPRDRPQTMAELRDRLVAADTADEWPASRANDWWQSHGCPVKKELDEAVLAGNIG